MTVIEITYRGVPHPQKRHRDSRFGGKYDPSEGAKKEFLLSIRDQIKGVVPLSGAISACFEYCYTRPKSHYKTGKHCNELKHDAPDLKLTKPDIDNLEKFILDSLHNKKILDNLGLSGVFTDDSQIVSVFHAKRYADENLVSIVFAEVDDEESLMQLVRMNMAKLKEIGE